MPDIAPAVPAATILLVRQAEAMEVLMVRRHHEIDFMSGALVFPGGKLSADDADPAWLKLIDAPAGISDTERALRIASVREAFEESGILLARQTSGGPLAPNAALDGLHHLRDDIAAGKASFRAMIEKAGLILALDTLAPFAHWITPENVPKRYDTYFFIAAAPEDQVEACDGGEAVEAVWLAPDQALAEGRSGKWQIVFPTRLNIEMLAETKSVDAAIAASHARKIVTVLPKTVVKDGKRLLSIPEDAGYQTVDGFLTL